MMWAENVLTFDIFSRAIFIHCIQFVIIRCSIRFNLFIFMFNVSAKMNEINQSVTVLDMFRFLIFYLSLALVGFV